MSSSQHAALRERRRPSRSSRGRLWRAGLRRRELHEGTDTSLQLRFHDLRATGISWLAMLPEWTQFDIRDYAGHSEVSTPSLFPGNAGVTPDVERRSAGILDLTAALPLATRLATRGRQGGASEAGPESDEVAGFASGAPPASVPVDVTPASLLPVPQPWMSQVQLKDWAPHSFGSAMQPLPTDDEHQPHPRTGVQDSQLVNWSQRTRAGYGW